MLAVPPSHLAALAVQHGGTSVSSGRAAAPTTKLAVALACVSALLAVRYPQQRTTKHTAYERPTGPDGILGPDAPSTTLNGTTVLSQQTGYEMPRGMATCSQYRRRYCRRRKLRKNAYLPRRAKGPC